MIKLYLAECTKQSEHEVGHALAEYALLDAYNRHSTLSHDERGKPYFAGERNIFVSISHSGERCLAAVSDRQIGADIEFIKGDSIRLLRLAERYFTAPEAEYVKTAPLERFYEIWCAKESYMKYTGEGFSLPMSAFSVLDSHMCYSHFTENGYAFCVCSLEHTVDPPIHVTL